MSNHANYRVIRATSDVVVIEDLGPWDEHMTVTNDAEHVVRELAAYVGSRHLLYFDSEGTLDELVIRDGTFAGFAPGARFAGV